jgi:L-lactate dehydrogenase complex protein LldF
MSTDRYAHLFKRINAAIDDRSKSKALLRCMKRGRDTRAAALETLPGGAAFRDDVRRIKERCIEELPRLQKQFVENARQRGVQVFEARSAADVIHYCLELAKARGATALAKSKSLTTEEVELNKPLIDAGIDVVETDLGELIIQLVNEKPFHLVFPSVHKMAPDVAEIFANVTGEHVQSDIPSLMKVVQKYLRPIFLNAQIGMTGANIGVAETGGICIETNEGNGRLVSSIGDCHVCIMGAEKIVATIEDAMHMILAHPVSASGQLPTTYVTWMHGRSPLGEGRARSPRESHLIIMDNGRSGMRADAVLREALYCIRCGACMNVCPTYGIVGGHTFGHIYPGPMGICWTAGVHGLEKAADFAPLCISCGLCKEICPAKIDLPFIIAEIKHRDAQKSGQRLADQVMMGADNAARLASLTAPLANLALDNKPLRKAMAKTIGLSAQRKLPPFAAAPFERRFKNRRSKVARPRRKVALFIDVYANYNDPDLGMAAVRHLEALDCQVVLPDQKAAGYPFIAYGDMDRARKTARYNVAKLAPYVAQGYEVVGIEPTATYCLAQSYPKLLNHPPQACAVADHTHELFEYLLMLEYEDGRSRSAATLAGKRFGYHCSCHQRPMGAGNGAMQWLRRRGAAVELIETGTCCGMGGTFGLKSGPLGHKLSAAVGEPLFALFKNAAIDAIVTESSVCTIQLAEGTGIPVYHPLQLPGVR